MKLSITKKPNGNFEFELQTASDKKPLKQTIDDRQLDLLVKMLTTARDAERFAFVLEL
jgi:hypothetical protein